MKTIITLILITITSLRVSAQTVTVYKESIAISSCAVFAIEFELVATDIDAMSNKKFFAYANKLNWIKGYASGMASTFTPEHMKRLPKDLSSAIYARCKDEPRLNVMTATYKEMLSYK